MPYVWTPADFRLGDYQETEENVNLIQIICNGDAETGTIPPTKLYYEITPPISEILPEMVVTQNSNTLSIFFPHFRGLFPMELTAIRAFSPQVGLQYVTVKRWEDLPEDAVEITSYKPDPSGVKTYTVKVGTSESLQNAQEFTFDVYPDYDIGKNKLLDFKAKNLSYESAVDHT